MHRQELINCTRCNTTHAFGDFCPQPSTSQPTTMWSSKRPPWLARLWFSTYRSKKPNWQIFLFSCLITFPALFFGLAYGTYVGGLIDDYGFIYHEELTSVIAGLIVCVFYGLLFHMPFAILVFLIWKWGFGNGFNSFHTCTYRIPERIARKRGWWREENGRQ